MRIKYVKGQKYITVYGWQVDKPEVELTVGRIFLHAGTGTYGFYSERLVLGSICLASVSRKLYELNKELK